jgi:hypothetical protein
MKKILAYTDDELQHFEDIYDFLDKIRTELDDEFELTAEREKLLDEAILAVKNVQQILDD